MHTNTTAFRTSTEVTDRHLDSRRWRIMETILHYTQRIIRWKLRLPSNEDIPGGSVLDMKERRRKTMRPINMAVMNQT